MNLRGLVPLGPAFPRWIDRRTDSGLRLASSPPRKGTQPSRMLDAHGSSTQCRHLQIEMMMMLRRQQKQLVMHARRRGRALRRSFERGETRDERFRVGRAYCRIRIDLGRL